MKTKSSSFSDQNVLNMSEWIATEWWNCLQTSTKPIWTPGLHTELKTSCRAERVFGRISLPKARDDQCRAPYIYRCSCLLFPLRTTLSDQSLWKKNKTLASYRRWHEFIYQGETVLINCLLHLITNPFTSLYFKYHPHLPRVSSVVVWGVKQELHQHY